MPIVLKVEEIGNLSASSVCVQAGVYRFPPPQWWCTRVLECQTAWESALVLQFQKHQGRFNSGTRVSKRVPCALDICHRMRRSAFPYAVIVSAASSMPQC